LLFCNKLSAIDLLFLAETHDRQRFDDQKNSKTPAVLPLFSAVLGQHAPIAQMTAVAQKVS
jgi:hypothetical protein